MAVLSLIETPDLRERLQKYLMEKDVEKVLFKGCQEKFAEWVRLLWESRCSCREDVSG